MRHPARTRIKFCGMTRVGDIQHAVALGVDAIGLIFAADSRRRLTIDQAGKLRQAIPPLMTAVALVMDAEAAQIRDILRAVRPDCLQFHGSEPESECIACGVPYLKAIPMASEHAAEHWLVRYPSAAGFVLDAHAPGQAGGGGQRFDWRRVPAAADRPILLAGGLDPDNIFEAICAVRPFAVDVASGIESHPGQKCQQRMEKFVAEVRRADAALASQDLPQ